MKFANGKLFLTTVLLSAFLYSCKTTSSLESAEKKEKPSKSKDSEIELLFAGDVMAHNVNYRMKDYEIIWDGVRDEISAADLAFANIEAPIDTTKDPSNYPYFNMPESYVQAVINAGFDVFSLSNNHTNDQELSGIKQTIITTKKLQAEALENGVNLYFSGVKESSKDPYSYCVIEKGEWKILFLAMTEVLNRPLANSYINYTGSKEKEREGFIEYIKKLREENPCDVFILSWHANEPEYIRTVKESQEKFYQSLLEAGVDIIWANHAHIIKDRKIITNEETKQTKIIMYANGNTISGQRTKPKLKEKNPIEERDNTGDGLMYKVILKKTKPKDETTSAVQLVKTEPIFITTYITPERNFLVKKLDEEFFNYLAENEKTDWEKYLRKRLEINETYTKDIIECQ